MRGAADGASINRSRAWILLACVVVAVCLEISFYSIPNSVKSHASEEITETTNKSLVIYGLARVINAAISVAQTSQVKVPLFASLQVGESLDPVNDAVERLSSVTVWAIGSLLLQDFILEVASTGVLQWGFWILGLAAISALLFLIYGPERFRDAVSRNLATGVMRTFFIVAIFRFIVPAFISIGFLFSSAMLEPEIEGHKGDLSAIRDQLKRDASVDDQRLDEQKTRKGSGPEDLNKPRATPERESEAPEKKAVEKPNGEASGRTWWSSSSLLMDKMGDAGKKGLTWSMGKWSDVKSLIEKLPDASSLKDKLPDFDSLTKKLSEMKSLIEKLPDASSLKDKLPDINSLTEKLSEMKSLIEKLPDASSLKDKLPDIDSLTEKLSEMKSLIEKMGDAGKKGLTWGMEKLPDMKSITEKLDHMISTTEEWFYAGKERLGWIGKVADKVADIPETMTRLLALVAIQNFVLPLIFLVIAVKCSRPIVRFVWLATDLTPGASASPVSSGRVDAG